MDNLGFIVAGFVITGVALGGYTAHLQIRARRAISRAAALHRKR